MSDELNEPIEELDPRLRDAISALPESIEPPPEVWAGIRARTIDAKLQRRALLWSLRYHLAAAAIVIILVSSGFSIWLMQSTQAPGTPASVSALADLTAAELEYDRVAAQLVTALNQQSAAVDTATLRIVRENLEIIDNAILTARGALARSPGNADLSRLISTGYQRKIDMLERTLRLSSRL